MDYLIEVGISFVGRIPYLAAWIAAVVFAALMVRRGGGKAEKFLLTGCGLMLFNQITMPFLGALSRWMVHEQGMPVSAIGIAQIPTGLLSLAGIVCLVYAFWVKFKKGKTESTDSSA